MRRLRFLLLPLLAVLTACQGPPPQRPVHVMLRPYLLRPGVDPAGDNAVVVNLYRDNGRVKDGPGRAAGTPWTSIRLLIRIGTTLPASMSLRDDDRVMDEGDGFERLVPKSWAPERGILRFEGPCAHQVLAMQRSGDSTDKGTYLAEMQMDGMYLQYLYGAQSHADHLRFAAWVYNWYAGHACPPSEPAAGSPPEPGTH